jgi:DUF4097 and DUF4098 domain-containing protein YvlB
MRVRAVILLTTLAAPAFALAAHADPSLNSQDVTTKVAGKVTALRVDADISNVSVTPGAASVVTAHLEWTFSKPTVTVSVDKGVLTVKARCDDELNGGPVHVGLINTCVDDLRIVVPAAASLVIGTDGSANVSRFTGPVDVRGGRVTVTDLRTPKLRISGRASASLRRIHSSFGQVALSSGNIDAESLQVRSLSLSTGSGNVNAGHVTAATFNVSDSSGNVWVTHAKADSLALSSGSGNVNADDVRSARATLATSSGNVYAQHVSAGRLEVNSGSGTVSVSDTTAERTKATSSSGNVYVQRVRGRHLDASTGNGSMTVADVHLHTIGLRSSSGSVSVQDLDAPDTLAASSGNGNVNVRVPSGRYYVQATSDNGSAHVSGLTVDRFAKREITAASSSGNVTVTGV